MQEYFQSIAVPLRVLLEYGVEVMVILALTVFISLFAAFALRRLGKLLRTGIAMAMLAVAMVLISDKPPPSDTNNNGNASAPARGMRLTVLSVVPSIDEPDEVTNGWRLVSVSSNVFNASTFAMPTNAVVWEDARECGAGYGAWRIPGGGWEFPFNGPMWTNGFLWVEGVFRSRFGNCADEIQILDERLTLCPQEHWADFNLPSSRAWYVTNGVGGLVATFENAAIGDDTNRIVSAQLELDPIQGEITLRYDLRSVGDQAFWAGPIMGGESNLVSVSSNTSVVVFRRVHPYDWDWDGIPNSLDDHPHTPMANPVWNQSEAWAALAFPSNSAEIAAAGGYFAWAAARGSQPNRHLIGLEISSPSNIWPICLTFGDKQVICNGKEEILFAINDGARYPFSLSAGELQFVTLHSANPVTESCFAYGYPYERWAGDVVTHLDSPSSGWIGRVAEVLVDDSEMTHFYPNDSKQITAVVTNCHEDAYIGCEWHHGGGITFSDPHSLSTTVIWDGDEVWATNYVELVTMYEGGYSVTNVCCIDTGVQSEPNADFCVFCQDVFFLNDADFLSGSDCQTNRPERIRPIRLKLKAARGTGAYATFSANGAGKMDLFRVDDNGVTNRITAGTLVPLDIADDSFSREVGITVYASCPGIGEGNLEIACQLEGGGRIFALMFRIV